jgi:hypothetical protein
MIEVSPDSPFRGYFYGRDVGGNENVQFYYVDSTSSKLPLLVTDGSSMNRSITWWRASADKASASESNAASPFLNTFAYSSNKRDGKHFDVYVSWKLADQKADQRDEQLVFESTAPGYFVICNFTDNFLLLKQ